MKILTFIKDWWFIPVLFILAIVAFLTFKKWRTGYDPFKQVVDEINIIRAGQAARDLEIRVGAAKAVEETKAKYAEKMLLLEVEQKQKAEEFENDPIALARFLERVTR